MRSLRRSLATGLLVLATAAGPASAAHPHYQGLLREGSYALERGRYEEAVRSLRLACFGLLDEPPTLVLCLTQLGVAQAATGDGLGFRETFQRVAAAEERFDAYTEADLPPALRAGFEEAVVLRIPPAVLETTPTFARLVAAPPPPPAARPNAVASRPAETEEPAPAVVPPPPPPRAAPPPPRAAPPPAEPPSLTPSDRAQLDRARELMAAARTREDLEEPFRLASAVADAKHSSRTAQYLAAEIAYRAGRWREAVAYFRRGGDPGDGNAMLLFYLAVALYETGEDAAAADALERSLPQIEHTPFVRSYRAKILGDGAGGRP